MTDPGTLRTRVLAALDAGFEEPLSDEGFDVLAAAVLRFQADANPVYGGLCRLRGVDPAREDDWRAYPPVPARAFKELPPVAGEASRAEAVFRTSGTTAGRERRGEHHVLDLELYHRALLPNARAHLLPEAPATAAIRVLSLSPPPAARPDSSLAHMLGFLHGRWDDGRGGFFTDASWAPDHEGLGRALEAAAAEGAPVLLAGTAFGLVHWLDLGGPATVLADGSRIVETGGFKGRSREVGRVALYDGLERRLGVPGERIVNEYGMTELLSQLYEPVLREGGPRDPDERRLVGPPWMRTRVLDPATLEPVSAGDPGLLCHLDLANLFSAALVLTEDRGVEVDGGVRVLGRMPGAEPRGCSLTMEDYLAAREAG